MANYRALKKKIEVMKREVRILFAPYIAFISKSGKGYQLSIGTWDGKSGSGGKSIVQKYNAYDLAKDFLTQYLKEHKPIKGFVSFSGEENLEEL